MTFKVGIIGPGMIARGAHMRSLSEDSRAEIIAVSSRSEETAKKAAAEYQVPHWYTSEEKMLESHEFDLIIVATPNKFHAASVMKALRAGANVLCEKPPAKTAAEAKEMEKLAGETGKYLFYGFQQRFNPEAVILKRAIESGDLGDIYHISVQALRRRGIPGWGCFIDKDLQGGGPLIDVGVHMLDLAAYLSGFPEAVEVSAVTHQQFGQERGVGLLGDWNPEEFSVEDFACGMIRFKNGMSLLIETSFAANTAEEETLNVKLYGNKGGAELRPFKIYGEKYGTLIDTTPVFFEQTHGRDSFKLQAAHILDVLEGKADPVSLPGQGTYIQVLIESMYASAETGRAVKVEME